MSEHPGRAPLAVPGQIEDVHVFDEPVLMHYLKERLDG